MFSRVEARQVAATNTSNWLGAIDGASKGFLVLVFVPSQTRNGDPINHEAWRSETLQVMASLFGGATATEGSGGWRDDDEGGEVKIERVSVVVSFMAESDWNQETVSRLARFLHRMGREAKQGEIGLIVNGEYHPIRKFDK
jgi:hypothetical protein